MEAYAEIIDGKIVYWKLFLEFGLWKVVLWSVGGVQKWYSTRIALSLVPLSGAGVLQRVRRVDTGRYDV